MHSWWRPTLVLFLEIKQIATENSILCMTEETGYNALCTWRPWRQIIIWALYMLKFLSVFTLERGYWEPCTTAHRLRTLEFARCNISERVCTTNLTKAAQTLLSQRVDQWCQRVQLYDFIYWAIRLTRCLLRYCYWVSRTQRLVLSFN